MRFQSGMSTQNETSGAFVMVNYWNRQHSLGFEIESTVRSFWRYAYFSLSISLDLCLYPFKNTLANTMMPAINLPSVAHIFWISLSFPINCSVSFNLNKLKSICGSYWCFLFLPNFCSCTPLNHLLFFFCVWRLKRHKLKHIESNSKLAQNIFYIFLTLNRKLKCFPHHF